MTLRLLSWLAGVVLLASSLPVFAAEPSNPVIQLSAGMYRIQAEVADSPATLQKGLMFRSELTEQGGMLFLFPSRGTQCMWMRNTLVPLSVAFLHDDGTIVNIEDMAPQTETSHCSAKPVRAALEMNAGWFAKRGIKAGMKIGGMPAQW